MSELQAFLKQQQSEGTLDSQGSFTLDLSKAHEKLQQYQFENPHYYILKLIQAAVALNGSEVSLSIHYDSTRLGMLVPQAPTLEQLLEALRDPPGVSQPGLRHLAIGLNARMGEAIDELTWIRKDKDATVSLTVNKQQASTASGPGLPALGDQVLCQLIVTRITGITVAGIWDVWAASQEHKALYESCAFTPIDLRLDGRSLAGPWAATPSEKEYLAAEYFLSDDAGPKFLVDAPPLQEFTSLHPAPHAHYWTGAKGWFFRNSRFPGKVPTWLLRFTQNVNPEAQRLSCQMAMRFTYDLRQQTKMHWIVDGVKLPEERLDLMYPGLEVLLIGNSMKTDLSEFRMVRDEIYEARLKQVEERARHLLEFILAHRDKIQEPEPQANYPVKPSSYRQERILERMRVYAKARGLRMP